MQGSTPPYRRRLIEGVLASVKEKGYARTTIASVVRHAGVSKRTFYEHFKDKEACFLAAYAAASEHTVRAIVEAAEREKARGWEKQLRAALRTYLAALEAEPVLTRTFLVGIHAAGARALAARRRVHERYAEVLRGFAQSAHREDGAVRTLSAPMALALVGGINELVLDAVEQGRPVRGLEDATLRFVRAVIA